MNEITYLDNSSTTKPCREAVDAVINSLGNNWGNPSSLHRLGIDAELAISDARSCVARLISSREDEIYFTGCGSESNNTAIIGAANARKKQGRKIVTTSIEHPSVLETVKRLENEGFETVYIRPDSSGKISAEQIYNAIDKDTALVSIMLANNETGLILPVEAAHKAIKEKGSPALLHCDAVQAFGKMPVKVGSLGVDLLSASGHKIHAPKGIGILYIRKGVTIKPFITGGGQENGMRSGTQAVSLICGLGAAVKALPNTEEQLKKQCELLSYTKEALVRENGAIINSPDGALPYILNVSLPGYRSETLLHFLESKNVFVSSGSACSKGKVSYVLNEFGFDKARTDSAIRISFSRYNTKADADNLVSALKAATEKLRRSNI